MVKITNIFSSLAPGIIISILIALAAQFLSNTYQFPAMLMALLLGMSLNFLSEEDKFLEGLTFSNQTILKIGIILLGVRISIESIFSVDIDIVLLVTSAVFFTIIFAIILLKIFGFDWRFGVLVGGSVAICGASAAMAIAAVLPKDSKSDERLTFVVLGVTILSTLAMIIYPIISNGLSMNEKQASIFLGATIHDVAQVVGAGFSISDLTGEKSTLIKLYRVTLLFPTVLIISLLIRNTSNINNKNSKTPLIPIFIILFIFCTLINTFISIPNNIELFLNNISKWCLLVAIAAVGVKTRLEKLKTIGFLPSFLITIISIFLMIYVLFLI